MTDLGFEQCRELQEHLRRNSTLANDVELIVSSPMLRTLQTTYTALDWLIGKGIPVMARAEWQGKCDAVVCELLSNCSREFG